MAFIITIDYNAFCFQFSSICNLILSQYLCIRLFSFMSFVTIMIVLLVNTCLLVAHCSNKYVAICFNVVSKKCNMYCFYVNVHVTASSFLFTLLLLLLLCNQTFHFTVSVEHAQDPCNDRPNLDKSCSWMWQILLQFNCHIWWIEIL